jgi:hypothetical protein
MVEFCHLVFLITSPNCFYHDLKMSYTVASQRQLQSVLKTGV